MTAETPQYDKLRNQLAQGMTGDLLQQYAAALEKDYGVRVNSAQIDQQLQR
jgi:hypothetical protein